MPYKDAETRRLKGREYVRRYKASRTPEQLAVFRQKDRESSSKWRAENRERHLQNCKDHHEAHRDEANARRKQQYLENFDRERQARKEWAEKNPEARRVAMHKYYTRHRDSVLSANKAWKDANPEKRHAHNQARRSRYIGASGHFTAEEFSALCDAYDNSCAYCGEPGKLEADHDVPLSRGGSNYIENIRPACGTCNRRKHTKTAAEFLSLHNYSSGGHGNHVHYSARR